MKNSVALIKISGMILVLLLLCCGAVCAESAVEFFHCNIIEKRISDGGFNDSVLLKTVDENGIVSTYYCAKRIRINGTSYREAEDIFYAVSVNSFAKIAVQDGVITVLNFDDSSVSYQNVAYQGNRRSFHILNSKQANLPVYYQYNGEFVSAHLDENHLYDIEVYDYAICVTDMKSKTDAAVLDYIDIGSAIGSDFRQHINVYCESEAPGNGILSGELYDKRGALLETQKSADGEFSFGNLANEQKTYLVKLWLEDENGNKISSDYEKLYTVEPADICYGFILKKGVASGSITEHVELKTNRPDGSVATYDCAERVRINGTGYRNAEDIYNAVETETYVKMAVENGVVTVLDFDTASLVFADAVYDFATKRFSANGTEFDDLPVYYQYNEEFVSAHLDENHLYDIEVYDYAICVTDMKSKTDAAVLDYIDIGSAIGSDFRQHINVYCESEAPGNGILSGELYDKRGALLETQKSADGEFSFGNLANEQKTYLVKLWLEDENGNKISSDYEKLYTVEPADICYGFILKKGVASGSITEHVELKTNRPDGSVATYDCAERVRINGTGYRNAEDIYNAVETETYVKMAVENGVVTVLDFDTASLVFADAVYDFATKRFSANGTEFDDLPVYYEYNGDYAPAYLDENHFYDIEVTRHGICITDMKSKTDAPVIDYAEVSLFTADDFTRRVNVYCEVSDNRQLILKGNIYDEKHRLVSSAQSECSGWCELTFEQVKNRSSDCTLQVWLEDENHNKVSNSYCFDILLPQNQMKYGTVSFQYVNEDDGKVLLSVKEVDGTDSVYACDDDTNIIFQTELFSARNSLVQIPENAFVKMAVCDGIVSAIEVEPGELEVYAPHFSASNGLSGEISVLNNTEAAEEFTCYIAVFNADGIMKGCDIVPVGIESDDFFFFSPAFKGYQYAEGDYLKVFAWEDNLSSLLEATEVGVN